MQKLELWTTATPNGWKVSIMVEELKALVADMPPVEVRQIKLMKGEQFSDEFTRHNPNQKIPVLIHGDKSIIESCAILHYLGETFPCSLLPDNESRWDILPWVYWQAANIGPAFGNRQSYVRYMDDVSEEQKKHPLERFLKEARRLSGILEDRLAERPFICGETYTIADIAIYPWMRGWKWSKVDMTDRPNILDWMNRIRSRSAVEAGLSYGAPKGEVDQRSQETKTRYKEGGSSIS